MSETKRYGVRQSERETRVTFRMFAACRAGECADCIERTYVMDRRDGEPALDAPVRVEACGCDCHAPDAEAVRP